MNSGARCTFYLSILCLLFRLCTGNWREVGGLVWRCRYHSAALATLAFSACLLPFVVSFPGCISLCSPTGTGITFVCSRQGLHYWAVLPPCFVVYLVCLGICELSLLPLEALWPFGEASLGLFNWFYQVLCWQCKDLHKPAAYGEEKLTFSLLGIIALSPFGWDQLYYHPSICDPSLRCSLVVEMKNREWRGRKINHYFSSPLEDALDFACKSCQPPFEVLFCFGNPTIIPRLAWNLQLSCLHIWITKLSSHNSFWEKLSLDGPLRELLEPVGNLIMGGAVAVVSSSQDND